MTLSSVGGKRQVPDLDVLTIRAIFAGKVENSTYVILNPHVVTDGNLAVLSYNLANYLRAADGSETAGTAWNSTEVSSRVS